ncbi:hypothetical protein MT325_m077L [Paramecium bursaria chlorella virus MT325]|uniref:Uncharacterized protein m077L n=1 Tax=Paramecium bursaria Chlorella virus MT325 TaxID=346932 RepID=A7ITF7_PBCVM|nr:hypothetical protein MT325_m077L [Paramecium bursaria chlorella virus MT325]
MNGSRILCIVVKTLVLSGDMDIWNAGVLISVVVKPTTQLVVSVFGLILATYGKGASLAVSKESMLVP